MTRANKGRAMLALSVGVALTPSMGCDDPVDSQPQNFSSNQATLVDFELEGKLTTTTFHQGVEKTIEAQLLYTIGQLNGVRSVGRLDRLELSNVEVASIGSFWEGYTYHVSYRAKLPVAWAKGGKGSEPPETFELVLPTDMSTKGQQAFAEAYGTSCASWDATDVSPADYWYFYRPDAPFCDIDPDDVTVSTATLTKSELNTEGRYPEYHHVWQDDRLDVVAIFGRAGNEGSDIGVEAYRNFVSLVAEDLADHGVLVEPATWDVADQPDPHAEVTATLPNGKIVAVTAMLVDDVSYTTNVFDDRYEALSATADLIAYNGHSGFGENIQALARKGSFVPNKYLMLFMNGCSTFAYMDSALVDARAELNEDDPTGTKWMDTMMNAMPSYFSSMPQASRALVGALVKAGRDDVYATYDAIFEDVDDYQVIVVSGEEDNVFAPTPEGP